MYKDEVLEISDRGSSIPTSSRPEQNPSKAALANHQVTDEVDNLPVMY